MRPPPMPAHIDDVDARLDREIRRRRRAPARRQRRARRAARDRRQKGFLSVTARVAIEYDGPAGVGAPRSLVVKIEPPAGVFLDTARRFDAFAREIHFYPRHGADALAAAAARILRRHASRRQRARDGGPDGSRVRGPAARHAPRAGRRDRCAAARRHAAYWNNDARRNPLDARARPLLRRRLAEHWPHFVETYELRVGREALEARRARARAKAWLEERIAAGLTTVAHGDLRADNLLFTKALPARSRWILDWQLANRPRSLRSTSRVMDAASPRPTLGTSGRGPRRVAM